MAGFQRSQNLPSILHKLFKRAAAASKSSVKTGFAGIVATKETKNRKKTRKCEEFKQEPITKRWKCIKFVYTKPVAKPESNQDETPSNLHKLIKRNALGSKSSAKTGFAGVIATKETNLRKKTRECEEFKQEPITKRWKCIKFLVVSKDS